MTDDEDVRKLRGLIEEVTDGGLDVLVNNALVPFPLFFFLFSALGKKKKKKKKKQRRTKKGEVRERKTECGLIRVWEEILGGSVRFFLLLLVFSLFPFFPPLRFFCVWERGAKLSLFLSFSIIFTA